jgi:hypothetical protein
MMFAGDGRMNFRFKWRHRDGSFEWIDEGARLLRIQSETDEYDGELRQTTFLGWRDDKDPKEVVI